MSAAGRSMALTVIRSTNRPVPPHSGQWAGDLCVAGFTVQQLSIVHPSAVGMPAVEHDRIQQT